ncbi:methyltransferase [Mammaliicoccus lentus]|jgi:putative Mg2+ transporter-C (MgtC) family protein|uniref:MgtC/SapB family protein n=1 Tax=Mammaliicoccus lentus TaxID=42858 RepID=A0AAP1RQ83_MAMLE|nr:MULTISPECIES: MgtC/SapB family protein [Mammaliicoccus]MBF0748829.1 MgtC/SapB family protein [Mammaliicoccus lentus]MBF0794286.1 MgtC/SapB family protein [Mammaliicoccus lentus]MBF0840731.1 MgtC/SapB family protein [Mammaliicoccus lentus]MBW0762581.1 MgtC/SapB family protein [Mammaliicoccus lentus]MBW0771084.1 MgtC/SapB family protein [Mammaliicoccus lentus]
MLFQLDLFLRIFLAVLCGAIIGYERSQRLKAAGIRTHILVSAASALFIIISKYGFNDILNYSNVELDPSRVAAQVVSGISFIGAGTILIKNQNINGLTTAAGLWITSGVGMALGSGLYFIGILSAILIVIIQYFLRENFIYEKIVKKERIQVNIEAYYSNYLKQDIYNLLKENNIENISFYVYKIDQDIIYLSVTGKVVSKTYNNNELMENLFSLEDVRAVN